VKLGGLSVPAAEARIAKMLRDGGFVKQPQVNVLLSQVRSAVVSVLGQVAKPGAYPLDKPYRLSEMLAVAGGITPTGADTIIVTRNDGNRTTSSTVDIAQMYLNSDTTKDVILAPGDVLYVHRAPKFYIYGEVQRPGSYRLERGMSVLQALAEGGGVTPRGTERGLQIHRRDSNGDPKTLEPAMSDLLRDADVVYVKERLF
jgi:polysaccharide export outer membrane protein